MEILKTFRSIFETILFRIGERDISLVVILEFLILIIVFYILSKLTRRLIKRRLFSLLKIADGTQFLILRLLHFLMMSIGILVALNFIGINLTTLTVGLGALSVGIGFGLQNITSNFVSGIILLLERHVNVGDLVTIQSSANETVIGRVHSINIRSTTLVTLDNVTIIVPNSRFIENTITNWSIHDPRIRVTIPVGVAYGSDTRKVTELLLRVAKENENVLKDPEPSVLFRGFGDSSLNFELLVWLPDPMLRLRVISELNYAIDELFRENNVTIPFPQRDVHIVSKKS